MCGASRFERTGPPRNVYVPNNIGEVFWATRPRSEYAAMFELSVLTTQKRF